MATTFIPSKPKKSRDRVQLSADELKVLLGLVWDQVKDKQAGDPGVESLGALLVKLGRAHNRIASAPIP